jgi:anaerobic selenocysteine-containing dehydrogenase
MEKQYEHEWKTELDDGSTIFRTCAWSPPGCHPTSCGVELTVKDGKIIHVEGDESQPITKGRLCPRCLALKDYTYDEQRIVHPMKRAREFRGQADKWEQTTWEEAYDTIEREVNRIKETYGAEAIAVYGGTGREASMFYYPLAYSVLGTPNVVYPLSGVSCYGPRQMTAAFILGAGYPEIDYAAFYPERFENPEYVVPKYVVCWGKMPLYSNGDGMFGHALIDLMKLGTRFICIDPRVTWLGAQPGNITVQLRAGTDTALALALINVIISEDLYDHEFVDCWCYGFDELAARAADYTPERVAEFCEITPEEIYLVARLISINHPVSIAWGLAVDQNPNGTMAGQAILSIAAITGNIDVPGGLTLGSPFTNMGGWSGNSMQYLPQELIDKKLGSKQYPAFHGPNATSQSDEVLDTLESGKPYELHMAWINSTNFLSPTCSAEPERWYNALIGMEFTVAQDTYMNPTIQGLADYFLPLPTFAEHDGLVVPYYGANNVWTACMAKAVDEPDTRSDLEICLELGKRLCPEAWGKYNSTEEWLDEQLMQAYGITWAEFREMGMYFPGNEYKKYEKGLMRPDGQPGFNTVTGRVELYCAAYGAWGLDPLPNFEEPRFQYGAAPEWSEKYPLIISSGARTSLFFHSELRQIDRLRSKNPDPILEMNPVAAKQRGIKDGDIVQAYNMFGHCNARVKLVETIPENTTHMQHGWWFPEDDPNYPNLYGVFKSNFNKLMPHRCVGQLGFGAPYKSMICEIRKVDSFDAEGPAVEDPLNMSNTLGPGLGPDSFCTEKKAV